MWEWGTKEGHSGGGVLRCNEGLPALTLLPAAGIVSTAAEADLLYPHRAKHVGRGGAVFWCEWVNFADERCRVEGKEPCRACHSRITWDHCTMKASSGRVIGMYM